MPVNGVQYDFESIELRVARGVRKGVKEIAYKPSREVGKVMGLSRKRIGTTIGVEDSECSFTILRRWLVELLADLDAESAGRGYGLVEFDIVVTYANDGDPLQTDTITRCTITGVDQSHASGPDGLEAKVDCDVRGDIAIAGFRMIAEEATR